MHDMHNDDWEIYRLSLSLRLDPFDGKFCLLLERTYMTSSYVSPIPVYIIGIHYTAEIRSSVRVL
jgi:hypothetical protein